VIFKKYMVNSLYPMRFACPVAPRKKPGLKPADLSAFGGWYWGPINKKMVTGTLNVLQRFPT